MKFTEFLDHYLAHLIAIIALAQVWLIAAWKKWVVKGKVQFHPTANVEIGFSAFGATVSLTGTLRALGKDVFVSQMHVTITRLKDHAIHNFTWRAFKSNTFSAASAAPEAIEIAASFTLPISTPRPINVFFASADFVSQYARQAEQLRNAWQEFVRQKAAQLGDRVTALAQTPGFADALFGEFSRDKIPLDLYTQLNHGFYWQAGRYRLDLEVLCAPPTKAVRSFWMFELSSDDEEKLRLNTITMMKELCNFQSQYNFIYKPYEPERPVADAT